MGACMSSRAFVGLPTRKEIEKATAAALAHDSPNDAFLAKIDGRVYSSGTVENGCLYTQQGKKGPNQDCMILWQNFGSREDTTLLGVFDGHGPYGHLVGKKVRDGLPCLILNQWQELSSSSNWQKDAMNDGKPAFTISEDEIPSDNLSEDFKEEEEQPTRFQTWKESHIRAFKVMDKELKLHPNLDCYYSGTTAVTVLKQGQELLISNVGDSRAILGTVMEGCLSAVQLTVDLKPSVPYEAERIIQCKGRVFALSDEPHVYRVWLPNNSTPGLAMTRAFGDFCLKDYGVIAVPEITYKQLSEDDQFIVLATDGIWEVLSNQEVVQIVASTPRRADAARMIVETAVKVWKHKFPTSKTDDCAVVCLYLHPDSNNKKDGNMLSQYSLKISAEPPREEQSPELQAASESLNGDALENEDPSNQPRLIRSGTVVGLEDLEDAVSPSKASKR